MIPDYNLELPPNLEMSPGLFNGLKNGSQTGVLPVGPSDDNYGEQTDVGAGYLWQKKPQILSPEIAAQVICANVDIGASVAKRQALNQENLRYEKQKGMMREELLEHREENKRARYQELVFSSEGKIYARTRNLSISTSNRAIFNFSHPQLWTLLGTTGESGFFQLNFILEGGSEPKSIYLNGERCGRPRYILKKVRERGGDVLTDKADQEYDYIRKLWAALIVNCGEKVIPTHEGWIKHRGRYHFVKKGEVTWKDVERMSR